MSDLFHKEVPVTFIDFVFDMPLGPGKCLQKTGALGAGDKLLVRKQRR